MSLFTGAGGLDLGFEAGGFETAAAIEFDADAVATLRSNRDWPIFDRDIHEVSTDELLSAAELKAGDADVLIGGPPCQPFSKSGYWANGDAARLDDPRASTLEAYLRVLRDAKPRAFLFENVAGLAYERKSEGLDLLLKTVRQINRRAGTNYSFSTALLRATDFGVPQERERFFVVGHREGISFKFPAPTHGSPTDGELIEGVTKVEPARTAWDALGDLQDDDDPGLRMSGKWADLLPSIPEGQNYLWHTDRGGGRPLFGWRRRYWSFLLKLAKRLPSWTITAQPGSAIGPFHWRNRRLSMRELCRLQTFPDGYIVGGSRVAYQRQIGNAVPCALAEVLAIEIRRQLLGEKVTTRPTLVPPHRGVPPLEEPRRTVPRKYLGLAGKHEAHPGTGLGYAAIQRRAATA